MIRYSENKAQGGEVDGVTIVFQFHVPVLCRLCHMATFDGIFV